MTNIVSAIPIVILVNFHSQECCSRAIFFFIANKFLATQSLKRNTVNCCLNTVTDSIYDKFCRLENPSLLPTETERESFIFFGCSSETKLDKDMYESSYMVDYRSITYMVYLDLRLTLLSTTYITAILIFRD